MFLSKEGIRYTDSCARLGFVPLARVVRAEVRRRMGGRGYTWFGEVLYEILRSRGSSQSALAREAQARGYDYLQNSISNWMRGVHAAPPDLPTLLEEIYDLTAHEWLELAVAFAYGQRFRKGDLEDIAQARAREKRKLKRAVREHLTHEWGGRESSGTGVKLRARERAAYEVLDLVFLPEDIPELGLEAGTTGTVSKVYDGGRSLMVHFGREDGTSAGLVDLHVEEDGSLRLISYTPLSSPVSRDDS